MQALENSAFEAWLQAYGEAWIAGDPDAVAVLFAPGAIYYETPFDTPFEGVEAIRRYWLEGAGQAQKDVSFAFTVLGIAGRKGIAHWRASFERIPSGAKVELDGVLEADFDSSGHCRVFREWWHRRE